MFDFERHPILSFFIVVFIIAMLSVGAKIIFFPANMASQAIDVAAEQFGPRELLRKYESFKDMAAQLDKYKADITVYESRLSSAEKRGGKDRASIEALSLIESELTGIKLAYNSLAAEYNSNMSKFNYRFTNVGDLPSGATEPLPREFRAYLDK